MELQRPIIIRPGRKKKRRYSKGLGDLQKSARGFSKLSARAARAYSKGFQVLYRASDKSAQQKRDGALRDLGKNLGKAASQSLRATSGIPKDVSKIMYTRSMRQSVRRQIRIASFLNRRLGLR
jgi:Family of unknown function (DUF6312)